VVSFCFWRTQGFVFQGPEVVFVVDAWRGRVTRRDGGGEWVGKRRREEGGRMK